MPTHKGSNSSSSLSIALLFRISLVSILCNQNGQFFFELMCGFGIKIANLISKLNFYKLIPYPMDNCFTGRRDRSRQTSEKDVLYIIPAGPVRRTHSPGGASYFLFLSRQRDVTASFSCLDLVRPLVS